MTQSQYDKMTRNYFVGIDQLKTLYHEHFTCVSLEDYFSTSNYVETVMQQIERKLPCIDIFL